MKRLKEWSATNPKTGTRYAFPWQATEYVARVRSMYNRGNDVPPCDEGHFECALWEGGPCSARLEAEGN